MKTAKEFLKEVAPYFIKELEAICLRGKITDIMERYKKEALTEHDNEIIQLVSEMKDNPEGMELTKEEYNIYLCGYDDALTELKTKLEV